MARSVKERGEAAAAGIEKGGFAPNVKETLLLTGKARAGKVLGGRA